MLKLDPEVLFLDMKDKKGIPMREHCPEPLREPTTARDRFWEIENAPFFDRSWEFPLEYYDAGNYPANVYERLRFFYDLRYRFLNRDVQPNVLRSNHSSIEMTAVLPRNVNSYLRYFNSLKINTGCPDHLIGHHEKIGCSFTALDCPNKQSAGCLHIADIGSSSQGRMFLNSLVFQMRTFVDGITLLGGNTDQSYWNQTLEGKAKEIDSEASRLDQVAKVYHDERDNPFSFNILPEDFIDLEREALLTRLQEKRAAHRQRVLEELVLPFEQKILQVLA